MAESPGRDWSKLKCECNSIYFTQVVYLITRQGGGTTESPAGYQCQQCHGMVDTRRLLDRLELERKKADLRALEEQVDADEKSQLRQAKVAGANAGTI